MIPDCGMVRSLSVAPRLAEDANVRNGWKADVACGSHLTMREPDFERDGWCLADGEALHDDAPDTFWIPDKESRDSLRPGDFAKLVFEISVASEEEPVAVERMWVLVRGRIGEHYFVVLDNDPYAIEENDELWSGVEIPFSARHVIAIDPADEASIRKAMESPTRTWPRADLC